MDYLCDFFGEARHYLFADYYAQQTNDV